MKTFYLFVTIILFFFIGCSTSYVTQEFKSKMDFNKHFNQHAEDKNLNIQLKTDSVLTTNAGARIENDSLVFVSRQVKIENIKIPLKEINSLDYKIYNSTSTHLSLKNGKEIEVDSMVFLPSMLKCNTKEEFLIKNHIPLNFVKGVSYNNHLEGTLTGMLYGVVGGLLITISKVIPANVREGNPPYPNDYDYFAVGIISIPLGILVGGITGGFIGHKYNYEFNP